MSIATTLDLEVQKGGSNYTDTSSGDETDRRRRPTEKSDAVGRSYECTFCKRGFTNAQALGGHMNIHRKDKLKVKQKSSNPTEVQSRLVGVSRRMSSNPQGSSPSPNSNNTHQFHSSSSHFTQIPSPRTQHVNFLFYPQNEHASHPGNLGLHGDFMDANLTLGIGSQSMEEDGGGSKEAVEKNEVDLELRLGHHKYS